MNFWEAILNQIKNFERGFAKSGLKESSGIRGFAWELGSFSQLGFAGKPRGKVERKKENVKKEIIYMEEKFELGARFQRKWTDLLKDVII